MGAGLKEFQKLFGPRVTELARDFIAPLDELSNAVGRAEQELEALRSRQLGETAQIWSRYKPDYERYLRPQPLTDEEEDRTSSLSVRLQRKQSRGQPAMTRQVRWPRRVNRPPISGLRMRTRRQCPRVVRPSGSPTCNPVRSLVVKAGDVINGYTILEDFKVVGAGLSKWTFAERGGRQYFIKEFLSPTYPDDYAPGSEKTKAKKRARCAAFEAHHRGIQHALAPLSAYGGNLIVTLDFFRWGAKYYKVTEKVDAEGLSTADIAALGLPVQLVLMKTVAHSLKILHDLRIVHSDLKPSNVLIKRTELGYTTKLIDFDNSYIAGRPPPREEIVGTINYYSPELLGYIQDAGVAAAELGRGL